MQFFFESGIRMELQNLPSGAIANDMDMKVELQTPPSRGFTPIRKLDEG